MHALLGGQEDVDAEPVHADVGARGDELLQVGDVGGVAGVADDHAGQVDALLGEDGLLLEPAARRGVGVRRDRHPGLAVRRRHGPQDPLHPRRDTGFVGGALQDRGLDPGVGDAVLDVADEHLGHDLRAAERGTGAQVVEVHRQVVEGVEAGGHHDVQLGGRGDPGDARKVAAEADHREIDDGVHPARLQLVEPRDGVGLPFGAVAPPLRVVLHDLGGHHEDVLVHQRDAEIGGVDGAARRVQ